MNSRRVIAGLLFGVLVVCGAVRDLAAQQIPDSLGALRLDFAIPDAPAFTILDENPSEIVRPGNVREVGISLANFLLDDGVLPSTFAAEFSPGMLIGGSSLTLQEYQSFPMLYRARLSLAATRENPQTGATKAGLGLRISIIDDNDPRTDQAFIDSLAAVASAINDVAVMSAPSVLGGSGVINVDNSATVDSLQQRLAQLRRNRKETGWNNAVWEVGAALELVSGDSSIFSTVLGSRWRVWTSATLPFGEWGQLLAGGNVGAERDSTGAYEGTPSGVFAARLYVGTNALKFFAEAQVKSQGDDPHLSRLVNSGGELALGRGFWLEFKLGTEGADGSGSRLVTNFSVRWGLPENLPGL